MDGDMAGLFTIVSCLFLGLVNCRYLKSGDEEQNGQKNYNLESDERYEVFPQKLLAARIYNRKNNRYNENDRDYKEINNYGVVGEVTDLEKYRTDEEDKKTINEKMIVGDIYQKAKEIYNQANKNIPYGRSNQKVKVYIIELSGSEEMGNSEVVNNNKDGKDTFNSRGDTSTDDQTKQDYNTLFGQQDNKVQRVGEQEASESEEEVEDDYDINLKEEEDREENIFGDYVNEEDTKGRNENSRREDIFGEDELNETENNEGEAFLMFSEEDSEEERFFDEDEKYYEDGDK